MQLLRTARWLLLVLLLPVIPASLHAQFSISVNFAPPEMPVYVQPMCPQPNLLWTPGYWSYDADNGGYFWVPGAWVPALPGCVMDARLLGIQQRQLWL